MSWLFDTVALSEATKPRANPGFIRWIETVEAEVVYTSVLCLGEIRRGIEMLPPGDKRYGLEAWLTSDLPGWLGSRVLPIDLDCSIAWGAMGARSRVSPIDALIAATALNYGLTVVTRNVRDFDGLGVAIVNPWTP